MNFDSITTPAELLAQNESTKTPFEQAVEALSECDYTESMKLVQWLVSNMVDFHKNQAALTFKEEVEGNPLMWAHDAGKLELILENLKSID